MTEKATPGCMECRASISLVGEIKLEQMVTCPECGTEMEVIGPDPVRVDWVYDESK
jgi:lysine biosynthesis protein LysW